MRSKNFLYLFIFLVLTVASYFLVIKKPWVTLNQNETDFAVDDTFSIGKIFMADMEGRSVTLTRTENGWMINNQYRARNDYMEILLSTIRRIGILYPVADAAKENVIKELTGRNTKVEIYDRLEKKLNSYFIGGGAVNNSGNYVLKEGAKNPYVAGVPGLMGVIDSRYVTDPEEIRDRTIFQYSPGEIKNISVQYRSGSDSSFAIQFFRNDSVTLTDENGVSIPSQLIERGKLNAYVKLFSFINAEAFVNSLKEKRDSITSSQHPFCIISVTAKDNQQEQVKCYHMPRNKTSDKYDPQGNELPYDTNRYFALIHSDSDFVIIQQFHFGRLFKKYSDFIKSPVSK